MLEMERLMGELPEGIGYQWTGMSFQERLSGSQAPFLYALSILVVFLCLAALYESWSIPLSVILVVPLGVLGALVATSARGLSNDVYFQIGLLATIGLAAKNAILIVEFARELFQQGASLADAAMEAARLRLRPILMTSLAFLIGVLPLAISTGAGSGSQNAIGTGVMGGTFAATRFLGFSLSRSFSSWSSACSTGRLGRAGEPPFRRKSVRKSVRLDFGATGGSVKTILYCPTRYAGGVSWN